MYRNCYNRELELVCPECLSGIAKKNGILLCPICSREYPIIKGFPSFTDTNPLFEGRFVDFHRPSAFESNWIYPILEKVNITQRRISFLKKCLKSLNRKSLILDVGCGGGGWGMILERYGTVIGIDVSVGSLKFAQDIYKNLFHASATQIPFPSGYFDAVVSEDVLGHIPLAEKDRAYSEMYRVLKPDGLMVHSAIETDSKSFWFRFAKKYPDLFKTHHIDKHGHIGLELASVIIDRCLKIGFNVKKVVPMHAMVLYPSLISAWFDNGYKNENMLISALVSFSRAIEKSKRITLVTNLTLGIVEKMINPFINIDQAAGLLLCCKK